MKLIKISLIVLLVVLIAYQVKTYKQNQGRSDNDPVISSDVDEIQIPCQYTKEDLLQGLSAHDEEDGDITEKILIGGFSDFTQPGVSSLEYAVYDKDGNMNIFRRKVVFSDYISPRITILDPLVFKASSNTYNIPATLSVYLGGSDLLDGDISKHLLISDSDVDFSEPGKYTVSASLKNSFGDEVEMVLPIHILDSDLSGYAIQLTESLLYVEKGETINPEQYVAAVRNEYTSEPIPDKEYKLTIHSDVDTSKDGIYEIQFSAISSDKVQRGETWLTVAVGDYGG